MLNTIKKSSFFLIIYLKHIYEIYFCLNVTKFIKNMATINSLVGLISICKVTKKSSFHSDCSFHFIYLEKFL